MSEDWKHYFEQSLTKTYFSFEGEESDFILSQISFLHQIEKLQLEEFDVAIIGVADGRYSANKGVADYPNVCRSYLFGLRSLVKSIKILDLGNLLGKTVDDRYRALEDIITILAQKNVLPVIIGGSQDYTIPLSGAIKNIKDTFRLSVVDAKIDWVIPEKDFSSHGYLGLLSSDKNRKPYDLSVIGVQKYLYSRYQEQKMKKASFDFLRLGEIRQKGLPIAEPWLRDADVVSFDLKSVKQPDQPAHSMPMPNGFSGNEFCQLCWYAGVSDQLKVVGFFELDVNADVNSQGSMLGAQGVWHVLEGFCNRYNDFPVKDLDGYSQYIVHLDDYEIDIRFYNNPTNGRWWVEVPSAEGKQIVACSKDEFEEASKNELPERWYRFINKKVL
ncbi:arginase family protein [Carboxylicivirga linearis]|uniref:Arginase family protein n=1 Tax=Carboxylicivirga linearis TaxID=1628157 RepID=A0ABS5JTJ7_9BACT|nr:arginase family protein [Carboxylicivirga linearis]MBS2098205.1 arginase family protein [Carboxylicivirga linearis]